MVKYLATISDNKYVTTYYYYTSQKIGIIYEIKIFKHGDRASTFKLWQKKINITEKEILNNIINRNPYFMEYDWGLIGYDHVMNGYSIYLFLETYGLYTTLRNRYIRRQV